MLFVTAGKTKQRVLNLDKALRHDVDYHTGEPFDPTDWNAAVGAGSVTWSSPETFAQNPDTNALRFATMYNYWFDADAPPATGDATIGLFRPGTPDAITAEVHLPAGSCAADIDGDGEVAVLDLIELINAWGPCGTMGCPADLDGDGEVAVLDLIALITAWGPC